MSNRKTVARVGGGLAVVLVAVWYFWPAGIDPNLAKVQKTQSELFGEKGKSLTPDQRRDMFARMGKEMSQLTPEQRQKLREEGMNSFRDQMRKRAADFCKLSPAERIKFLDREIAESEKRRKQFADRGGPGGRGGPRGRGGPQGPPGAGGQGPDSGRGTPGKADSKSGSSQSVAEKGTNGTAGAGSSTAGNSPTSRDDRRRQFLDSTTPEERAQAAVYSQAMRARRQQLGLTGGRGGRW